MLFPTAMVECPRRRAAVDLTIRRPIGHTLANTLSLPEVASRERPASTVVTSTGSKGGSLRPMRPVGC
jgi:hypothetical protein